MESGQWAGPGVEHLSNPGDRYGVDVLDRSCLSTDDEATGLHLRMARSRDLSLGGVRVEPPPLRGMHREIRPAHSSAAVGQDLKSSAKLSTRVGWAGLQGSKHYTEMTSRTADADEAEPPAKGN